MITFVPTMTMLIGLPGSGKSTWAREQSKETGEIICSSDQIRLEMFGRAEVAPHENEKVFRELHRRIKDNLRDNHSVIYDATNISSKRRKAFLEELKRISCVKVAMVFSTPFTTCLENNINRDAKVPVEAITRMYKSWNTPWWFEGWDEIFEIDNFKEHHGFPEQYKTFNQNNPHHKHTLGEHCKKVFQYVAQRSTDGPLWQAALFHDIGKPFCECKDEDGISHYYNHENVGAYDAFTYYGLSLEASVIINNHMKPMNFYQESYKAKMRRLWGEELFDKIMLLNEADKEAH